MLKIKNWKAINKSILIMHLALPIWALAWMFTPCITGKLLLFYIGSSSVLGAIHKYAAEHNKWKAFVNILRVIAIVSIVIYYIPTVILWGFKNNKSMYSVKRYNYIYGVYEGSTYYKDLLPSKLPEKCEDYSFTTQGSAVAQDHHASSYLIFHTDKATLDSYMEHYQNLGCEVLYNNADEKYPEDPEKQSYISGKVEWICGQTNLRNTIQDNLDKAVVFWFDGRFPDAVLLNYETGLVVILT